MQVTAIKQQLKNSERVSVFVDGKYSFSLTLTQLLEEKLKSGVEFDEARLKYLKKLSAEGKLKARAFEWLLSRPHAEREFRDYLRRKQAEPDLIDAWTEEFRAAKYLNDKAFAEWFVQQRRLSRHRSNRAIKAELSAKGIEKAVVDEILAKSPDDELTALRALVQKKRRLSRYRDSQKIIAYLVRQGYDYSLVKAVLAEDEDSIGVTGEG